MPYICDIKKENTMTFYKDKFSVGDTVMVSRKILSANFRGKDNYDVLPKYTVTGVIYPGDEIVFSGGDRPAWISDCSVNDTGEVLFLCRNIKTGTEFVIPESNLERI